MDINEFSAESGMHDKDIVSLLHDEYPGYDKHLHSKVKKPEKYGVRLLEDAENLLKGHASETPQKARRASRGRYRYYIRYHVTESKREWLQQCFTRLGYDTMQSGIDALTDAFLKHPEILGEK
jgi:hypothetical protein